MAERCIAPLDSSHHDKPMGIRREGSESSESMDEGESVLLIRRLIRCLTIFSLEPLNPSSRI